MFAQMPEAGKNGYEHLINNVYLPADFDREVALKLAAKTFDARAAATNHRKRIQVANAKDVAYVRLQQPHRRNWQKHFGNDLGSQGDQRLKLH